MISGKGEETEKERERERQPDGKLQVGDRW
jgi:hypothetical protein